MSAARVPRGDLTGKATVLVYTVSGIMDLFRTSEVEDPEEELAPLFELAVEIKALAGTTKASRRRGGSKRVAGDAWTRWLGPEIPRSRWSMEEEVSRWAR